MNNDRKIRFIRRGLPPAVFLAFFISCVFWTFGSAGENASIEKSPISSASEIDYPPFCFIGEDGRAKGFSVELLQAVLKSMGREVTFRTGLWADVKTWLEQGQVQALPLVGRTPEREALFDFTFPYMSLHGAIVVRTGTTDIQDLSDLRDRKVAVMKGDNAEEFLLREDRGIRFHTTATFEAALRDLSRGVCDAVVMQRLVALRLIQQEELASTLQIINKPIEGFRQDFCFAVRDGDRETLALLNEGLAVVMADGTFRHLHAKWFAALELPAYHRIIIGGDSNYPPFESLDKNGQPAGYNVDLTRAIAREMRLDIDIRLDDWANIREKLAKGQIDAVHGMFYSAERNLEFDFSPPHTVINHVAVVRRGEGDPPETPAGLAGKRLVVMKGDIMQDFAIKNGITDPVTTVATQEEALQELAQGRYDCALVARVPALYWIKQHGWKELVVGQHPLLSAEYCYAVPKNRKALLAQLSEGLQVVEETGEYRRIHNKWFGIYENPPVNFFNYLRNAAIAFIPLLLILLAFFLWSWSLRKQVAIRTAALRENERKLQQSNEELTRFTCAVSHDLKSPIITIETFLGYLENDIGQKDAERIAQDVMYIRGAAAKMNSLLDELLHLSRIGHVVSQPVTSPLQTIVQEALDLLAGQISRRGVTVEVTEAPVQVTGDRPRLIEVFQNLIDNAVKFMGEQPSPRIEIGAEKSGEKIVFFVRDNGIGVDPLHQDKIFGLFEKLDSRAAGTGMGLALVKRIVEAHGGSIRMESKGPGQGRASDSPCPFSGYAGFAGAPGRFP